MRYWELKHAKEAFDHCDESGDRKVTGEELKKCMGGEEHHIEEEEEENQVHYTDHKAGKECSTEGATCDCHG